MQLRNTIVSNIPVIELYRQDVQYSRLPMLILYHGFESSKERKLHHAYLAATEGFFVVLPDAVRHGEREDSAFAALSYEQRSEYIFDIVRETSREIPQLLSHYRQQSFIDLDRCGIIGTSMGGMIIYDYLAQHASDSLKAASIIISTPDFGSVIDNAQLQNPEQHILFPETEIQRVKQDQPLQAVEKLKDFPIQLLNAEDDPLIPIQPVRAFYHRLHMRYERKETLKLQAYHNTGHQTTEEMMRRSVEWMKRWLL